MDVLQGTEGNDRIVAGEGKQILDGGKGNDVLNGGKGDDILIGGSGADVFVMYRSTDNKYYSSNENIADFNVDEDRIDLRMVPEYYSYEFLKEDFTKYGSGTAFQFYDESYNKVSIIIKGVAANDLTEDNFIFA
jgi:hypothetical protein